ncbi:MAG: hypothetical protein JWP00_896, partial [Chloroflexi bacterium]|nr:hypothetical protein [Chloroflexota bacterium]
MEIENQLKQQQEVEEGAAQGGDEIFLGEEDEEILDRVWKDPEIVEAFIRERDREYGTRGKTRDWRNGRPLTQEELDFFDNGPYAKGEAE